MQPLTRGQLNAYFARVKLPDSLEEVRPDLHMLCKMQIAHVQQIPYENLSLHLKKARQQFPTVSLHTDDLFRKMVQSCRGGYCYEQNMLFGAALTACGFEIYLLSARTIRSRSSEPGMSVIDHDQPHMAIGVVIDGVHWVADAGYGGKGLRLPIRNDLVHTSTDGHPVVVAKSAESSFTESTPNATVYKDAKDVWQAANGHCPGYAHRLRTQLLSEGSSENPAMQMHTPGLFMQAVDSKGQFKDLYFFRFQGIRFAEFQMLSWYTSTCPNANLIKKVIVAKQTPTGRHTYDGKEFKVFEGTKCVWLKHPETQEEEYMHLQQLFGINFD